MKMGAKMKLTTQQKDLLKFYELKAEVLAFDTKKPIGLCKNYYINEILKELNLNTTKNEKTHKQYLKTYNRLLKQNENIKKMKLIYCCIKQQQNLVMICIEHQSNLG